MVKDGKVSASKANMGTYNGGAGGDGSTTVNELGSVLNYANKNIKININSTYNINKDKLSYTKLNEIQTHDLTVGNVTFESLDNSILTVDASGVITPTALGKAKVKITDTTNGYFTYIIAQVIDGVTTSQVKIGQDFTLALKENGTVWTFGETGVISSTKPVQVMMGGNELENIVDIGAGNKISIALDNLGKVYTWGVIKSVNKTTSTNEQTGETTEKSENIVEKIEEPTEVTSLPNVIAVDAFGDNFYAVDSDGFAYIWGKGYSEPTKIDTKYKMADVDGKLLLGENGFAFSIDNPNEKKSYLNSVVDISYAEDHSLFSKADGRVLSIGDGNERSAWKWIYFKEKLRKLCKNRRWSIFRELL